MRVFHSVILNTASAKLNYLNFTKANEALQKIPQEQNGTCLILRRIQWSVVNEMSSMTVAFRSSTIFASMWHVLDETTEDALQ